jgi:putative ABC transport system ATP-binding protein
LLNILGLIDSPSSGAYWFNGEDVAQCSEKDLSLRRRARVGFVFQNFNLIEDLNVAENVEVALLYLGVRGAERRQRVAAALERVDLAHRARHLPRQLSGGQQQRVAIARALVAHPKLILADEPTGNLDSTNGDAVMDMLAGILNGGTTVVMVTHSEEYSKRAHRVVHMLDGRLVEPAAD